MMECLVRLPEGKMVVWKREAGSDVLDFASSVLGLPRSCLNTVGPHCPHNSALVRVGYKDAGLLGGKGGFGAGLRAMAKKRGGGDTQSFALCRDLQGNRLGQANAQEQLKQASDSNSQFVSEQWLLERPSWAEPVRSKRNAPAAAAAAPISTPATKTSRDDYETMLAKELERTEGSTADYIRQGLEHHHKRVKENGGEKHPAVVIPNGIELVSGLAEVVQLGENSFRVIGKSDFATVAFRNFSNNTTTIDVLPLSVGLVQFGFMLESALTPALEANLDGVGDVEGSFGLDFARQVFLQNGNLSVPITSARSIQALPVYPHSTRGEYDFGGFHSIQVDPKADYLACVSLEESESIQIRFSVEMPRTIAQQSKRLPESLADLEALGSEVLKQRLQSLGLKFGGTVQQRALRLYQQQQQQQ